MNTRSFGLNHTRIETRRFSLSSMFEDVILLMQSPEEVEAGLEEDEEKLEEGTEEIVANGDYEQTKDDTAVSRYCIE